MPQVWKKEKKKQKQKTKVVEVTMRMRNELNDKKNFNYAMKFALKWFLS